METTPTKPFDTDTWRATGVPQSGRRASRKRRAHGRLRVSRRGRRVGIAALVVAVGALGIGGVSLIRDDAAPLPKEVAGSPAWAKEHYGRAGAPGFRARHITTIDFLGRPMFVHEKAAPHFLRLERLFEARAPEYAAAVALGEVDDWSYANRPVRGERSVKSNHAFGLAIDVNALTNPLGTTGDMPEDVVRQWEIEGGEWGGDWSRPDPMHFETHLTPEEIAARYTLDGDPRPWYLEELIGG